MAERSLHLHDDEKHEIANLRFSRIAWVILLIFLILAAIGLSGSGPVSRAALRSGPLAVEYQWVCRSQSATRVRVTVDNPTLPIRLWVSARYLDKFRVDSILPAPSSSQKAGERVVFTFDAQDVVFRVEPEAGEAGWVSGAMGIEGGGAVEFRQLILP